MNATEKAHGKLRSTPMKRKPIYVTLTFDTAKRLRRDALLFDKTQEGIVEFALARLLTTPIETRSNLYSGIPKKVFGRRLK